mmetsp:Transcript_9561/g.39035  ORF Transcript_9561/g.39035 Transcript_9561/m.39035 type:complete len:271 (+) Transcript_9561:1101-1913(+)
MRRQRRPDRAVHARPEHAAVLERRVDAADAEPVLHDRRHVVVVRRAVEDPNLVGRAALGLELATFVGEPAARLGRLVVVDAVDAQRRRRHEAPGGFEARHRGARSTLLGRWGGRGGRGRRADGIAMLTDHTAARVHAVVVAEDRLEDVSLVRELGGRLEAHAARERAHRDGRGDLDWREPPRAAGRRRHRRHHLGSSASSRWCRGDALGGIISGVHGRRLEDRDELGLARERRLEDLRRARAERAEDHVVEVGLAAHPVLFELDARLARA